MPSVFTRLKSHLLYVMGLPIFYLGFTMLYRPTVLGDFFMMGDKLTFNTTILMCIILGVLLISRTILFLLWRYLEMTWGRFASWCVGEMVIMALFMALYMTLMYHGVYGYFDCVRLCVGNLSLILCYPYVIFSVCLALSEPSVRVDETALIRFKDMSQKLKVVLAAPAVLYVEAAENYVRIAYAEFDRVKTYELRNSMRGIEPLMLQHGLVRCQRSYYVNPVHVKTLTRERDGAFAAELDMPGTKKIPVSPKFYEDLTAKL